MKDDTNNGGPAFPCETVGADEHGEYRLPCQGMTLLDYFAAKAMHALISRGDVYEFDTATGLEVIAANAYAAACAMLIAREVQQ